MHTTSISTVLKEGLVYLTTYKKLNSTLTQAIRNDVFISFTAPTE